MSLYSHGIQLLPKPHRDVLSTGSESTRATLPDFKTVPELSQFLHRLFDFRINTTTSFESQAIAATSFIFLIIAVAGLILSRRIYEGKFWLIRVIRRSSGLIIVPNPIVTYLLSAGLCGLIFHPFFLTLCYRLTHFTSTTKPITNIVLWITLPWLILVYGTIWATISTYYATPNAAHTPMPQQLYVDDNDSCEEEEAKDLVSKFVDFLGNAKVINAMTLLLPLAVTVAIAIPSFISHTIWEESLRLNQAWQLKYATYTTFTQQMVQESQIIWYTRLRAAKVMAIVFGIYTAVCFAISLAYVPIVIRLIIAVRKETQGLKKDMDELQNSTVQEDVSFTIQISKIIKEALEANPLPQRPSRSRSSSSSSSNISFKTNPLNRHSHPDPDSHHHHYHCHYHQHAAAAAAACSTGTPAPHRGSTWPSNDEGRQDLSITRKQTENLLASALHHIYVQAIAIGLGTCCMGGISLAFSLTICSKLEQPSQDGGTLFEHYVGPIWLALLYASCLYGGVSMFTVAYKTYEPVFTSSSSTSSTTANGRRRSHIGFKDIAKGFEHIRSTFFLSHNVSSASDGMSPHAYPISRSIRRTRAQTPVSVSCCGMIVEAKTNLASRLQSVVVDRVGGDSSDWDIKSYRMTSSRDSSVGSSSPYSVSSILRS